MDLQIHLPKYSYIKTIRSLTQKIQVIMYTFSFHNHVLFHYLILTKSIINMSIRKEHF